MLQDEFDEKDEKEENCEVSKSWSNSHKDDVQYYFYYQCIYCV